MIKKYNIIILLLIIFSVSCSRTLEREDWYIKGGNIHLVLDWPEKHILMEDNDGLIFSGVLLSSSLKGDVTQIHARLDKVDPQYDSKYSEDTRSDFVIWTQTIVKDELKVIINEVSSQPYFFLKEKKEEVFKPYKQGRYLTDTEISNLMKDNSHYNLLSRYSINVIMNPEPSVTREDIAKSENTGYRHWIKDKYRIPFNIVQVSDYLQDTDPSTGYISNKESKTLELEYIINNKSTDIPTPLSQAIPIRGVFIRTGNLDDKSKFREYRRPQKITIYFSSQYSGGLGRTKGNYNDKSISILLNDEEKTYFIAFYEPIYTKIIFITTDSYYLGEKNEMALFDLAFFADNI